MRDQALARLDELKRQYQMGEGQLRELGRQEAALRETMLRITRGHPGARGVAGLVPGGDGARALGSTGGTKNGATRRSTPARTGTAGLDEPLTVP